MSEQSERMLRAAMKDQYRDMQAKIERLQGLMAEANAKMMILHNESISLHARLAERDIQLKSYSARLTEAERLLGEVHDCEDADHALDASLLVSIDEFLHPTAATDSAAPKKHTRECSYWDGLMAQVCNCGLAERDHNDD